MLSIAFEYLPVNSLVLYRKETLNLSMFAQFRSQYPQGCIQTEMLPKIDGLHAFRAVVSQGEAIMGTATAVDSDLELAEDRAVKRALAIAGISFDNSFENNFENNFEKSFGGYNGRSPMLTQVSREPSTVNSLPSAAVTHNTHTTHTIQSEPAIEYSGEYTESYVSQEKFSYPEATEPSAEPSPAIATPVKPLPAPIAPEPMDLSDAISKIDVEMGRLNWTKPQGRDYLVRTFNKRSRQELTNDELLQFLSHLKSLPTPYRQPDGDEFF